MPQAELSPQRRMSASSSSERVSKPLGTDNYYQWEIQMRALLKWKGVWGAVASPPAGERTAAQEQMDQKAWSLIVLNVEEVHMPLAAGTDRGSELWRTLQEAYAESSAASALQLRRQLNQLRKTPEESMAEYLARGRRLYSQMSGARMTIGEDDVVLQLLGGLPSEYDATVSPMVEAGKELRFDAAALKLIRAEKLRALRAEDQPNADSRALLADRKQRTDSQQQQQKRFKGKCNYCKKIGHKAAECWKKQQDEKKKQQPQQPAALLATALLATRRTGPPSTGWVLDSGCTEHMTPDASMLESYRPLQQPGWVRIGDDTLLQAVGKGTARMQAASEGRQITLDGVLVVPDLSTPLLSVSRALDKGATMHWASQGVQVHLEGEPLVEAARHGGLFHMQWKPTAPGKEDEALAASEGASSAVAAELWHRRYAHLGYDSLVRLKEANMVEGLHGVTTEALKAAKAGACGGCALAKHPRAPFPASSSQATERLQLVHTDLCGPMQRESLGGGRYVMTFLDDYSRLSVVRILPDKAAAAQALREVFAAWERQTGGKVQRVRSDRGGEYLGGILQDFLKQRGIVHETSAPHTPQQNGAAERLNRTLLERVRAMLHDSQLPLSFWAEAVNTANMVRNVSPASRAGDQTPWERFHGLKPDVSRLRVFGCKVYTRVATGPGTGVRKLDARSEVGCLVGYEPHSKAYRVWSPERRKLLIVRDVRCDEGSPGGLTLPADTSCFWQELGLPVEGLPPALQGLPMDGTAAAPTAQLEDGAGAATSQPAVDAVAPGQPAADAAAPGQPTGDPPTAQPPDQPAGDAVGGGTGPPSATAARRTATSAEVSG